MFVTITKFFLQKSYKKSKMNFLDILNLKERSVATLFLIVTFRLPNDTASYPRRTDCFEPHVIRIANYKISDIFSP